jgi:hypothetical protein
MARYLLDTNHLGAALDDVSIIRDRLYRSHQSGHRFGTCIPVLCELETGLCHTHTVATTIGASSPRCCGKSGYGR